MNKLVISIIICIMFIIPIIEGKGVGLYYCGQDEELSLPVSNQFYPSNYNDDIFYRFYIQDIYYSNKTKILMITGNITFNAILRRYTFTAVKYTKFIWYDVKSNEYLDFLNYNNWSGIIEDSNCTKMNIFYLQNFSKYGCGIKYNFGKVIYHNESIKGIHYY